MSNLCDSTLQTFFFSSHGLRLRWKFALWLISARNSGQTCSAYNFKLIQTCISFYFFGTEKRNAEEIKSEGTVGNGYRWKLMYINVPFSSVFPRRQNHKFDEFLAEVNQCAKFHGNPRPWLQELDMESFMNYVYVEKIWKQIFKILWKSSNQVIDCNQASCVFDTRKYLRAYHSNKSVYLSNEVSLIIDSCGYF